MLALPLRRLTWARLAALVTVGLTLYRSAESLFTGDHRLPPASIWIGGDLLLIALMARHRWRFAAQLWFALTSLLRVIELADHDSMPFAVALLASGLAVGISLDWPRFPAKRQSDPLPALSLYWTLRATALLILAQFLLQGERMSRETLSATAAVMGSVALASGAGPQWLWRVLGTLPCLWLLGAPQNREPTTVIALLGFAFLFPWMRLPRSAAGRLAGGIATMLAVVLLPPLLVAPEQVFRLPALGQALIWAVAVGLSLALAPRLASNRGTSIGRAKLRRAWLKATPASALAAVAAALGLSLPARGGSLFVAWAALLIPFAIPVLAARMRISRALYANLAIVAAILILSELRLGAELELVLFALGVTGASFLLSSARFARLFPRRVRVAHPVAAIPRAAFLGGSLLAAWVCGLALSPARAPELLDGILLPFPVHTASFSPALPPMPAAGNPGAGGMLTPDPLARGVWVSDEERDEVELLAHGGRSVVVPVPWPQELVAASDGHVWVASRDRGQVIRIAPDASVQVIAVGDEPRALALDEARKRLYIGLVADRELVAVDTRALRVIGRRALAAEPRDLALSSEGVAVLPGRGDAVELVSFDLARSRSIPLRTRSGRAWHGQSIVAAGRDLYAVHAAVDTGLVRPVSTGGYGGAVRAPVQLLVSVLPGGNSPLRSRTADDASFIPAADVTGAIIHGGRLWLASRGTGELLACVLGVEPSTGLTALPGWRCVRPAEADGLADVAPAGANETWAFASFQRTVIQTVEGTGPTQSLPLPSSGLDPALALGRTLFHQARNRRLSQGGLSCATCHPDGREDGLVWQLRGTLRQTPLLAGRIMGTAPYDWHGQSETLATNIRQTVERLGGSGLDAAEVAALVRYLEEGLRLPPLPTLTAPELVARGERIFRDPEVGCGRCHIPELNYTGAAPEDVGSWSSTEIAALRALEPAAPTPPFDVPSLRSLRLSAPYFHDGSAPTLEDLLANNHDRMGRTSGLDSGQQRALVAFLRSL